MKDRFLELAQSVKRNNPGNWYTQRNLILKVIEEIFKTYPDCYEQNWLYDGKINLIMFKYEGDIYFWWDGVNGKTIECSGLERMVGKPKDGKVMTEILWNSDASDHKPMIPQLPINFT